MIEHPGVEHHMTQDHAGTTLIGGHVVQDHTVAVDQDPGAVVEWYHHHEQNGVVEGEGLTK